MPIKKNYFKRISMIFFLIIVSFGLLGCQNQETTYSIVEEPIIIGKNTEWELNGLLTIPKDIDGKIPAVVLVHGSGASNMDEEAHAYKPFRDIAEYLAKREIAVIRYDKRSFTHGVKMVNINPAFTINEETIDDAILATEILRSDIRIDSNKVFIIGHSLGGMVAPRIDAEGGDFAGIIIMAGSPRRFSEIWHNQAINKIASLTGKEREIAQKQMEMVLDLFSRFSTMTDAEAKQYFLLGASGYYYKDLDGYPSNEYLKNIDKPLLIMQGEKDFQVFPDKDYALYQTLLQGLSKVTFKLYKNLNHFFINSTTGTIDEYLVENKVNEVVLQDITDWIKEN